MGTGQLGTFVRLKVMYVVVEEGKTSKSIFLTPPIWPSELMEGGLSEYSCCFCYKGFTSFTSQQKLAEHVMYNHGANYFYKCGRCSYQNRYAMVLRTHLIREHDFPKHILQPEFVERLRMDTASIQTNRVVVNASLD